MSKMSRKITLYAAASWLAVAGSAPAFAQEAAGTTQETEPA
jgi:hypothetical protein